MRASRSGVPGSASFAFLAVLLLCTLVQYTSAAIGWTQKSLVKTVELGGSLVQLHWDITATATGEEPEFATQDDVPLLLYLSQREDKGLSYIRGSVSASANKKESVRVNVERAELLESDPQTVVYAAMIPRQFVEQAKELRLRVFGAVAHEPEPLPKAVGQAERQFLVWTGDVGLRTPYETASGDVIVKPPFPNVLSYEPKDKARQSGQSITYGPYTSVPAHTGSAPIPQGRVHYEYSRPVISFVDFNRHVEISHWGDNMATSDTIWMRNDGAKLKGHFNRASHMINMWSNPTVEVASQIHSVPVMLPPAATDVYYVDATGNVSTSVMAPAPPGLPVPRRLELQPRFPIVGGWNYTFTVGWNQRMSEAGLAKRLPGTNRYRVAVPFLTAPSSVAIDHATVRIVLPEGASDIDVTLPFDVDMERIVTYPTYLDTVGRPSVVLERAKCTSKLNSLVYVDYTLSPMSHARKILAVATAVAVIFFVAA